MISCKLRFWETFLNPVSFREVAPWPQCQGGGADLELQGRGRGADLVPGGKGRGAGRGLQGKVEKAARDKLTCNVVIDN